MKPLPRRIRAW